MNEVEQRRLRAAAASDGLNAHLRSDATDESQTEAARHNLADALASYRRALNARPKPPGDSTT
ncbi:hypothetical protein [Saccharopolyspora endophytica]|uniref:Uncharacterized protein n=1 Tax=Saccharopolyspora endophytica TaxID=543886 RepID=A0ABS5DQH5_9PSEU|nr:hypothetical protein [Saccharopolyspora endophytica]MBQ0928564.1 hypothetical protein [Saccharopolyspora endophytica]